MQIDELTKTLKATESADVQKALFEYASQLTPENRKKLQVLVSSSGVLPKPPPQIVGLLWKWIVGAFVGMFLITGIAMTIDFIWFAIPPRDTQFIFTMFTAVSTFLAGLLVPTPKENADTTT